MPLQLKARLGRNGSTTSTTGSLRPPRSLPTLKVAVVHPCDASSVGAVVEAVELGLIEPILVGPRSKILAAAELIGKDISGMRFVEAAHSHEAAQRRLSNSCGRGRRRP